MKEKVEKLKQFIVKYDELFFIIIFFTMIIGRALWIETIAEDEIWNFQNIYKMYNGYKIYVDANVITTPLFHFLGLIIFKIFGANFFIFKLYNVFICLFLYLGIYKIFKALLFNKLYSFNFSVIMFLVSNNVINSAANYNELVITFVIYAVLIILKKEEYKNYILYESIFIFLIIITKQNVGIFYLIGYIMYVILNRKQCKNMIKILMLVFILLCFFVYILFKLDILYGFINYCFLGIKEFGQNNFSSDVKMTLLLIFISLVNGLLILYINYKRGLVNDNEKNNIKTIACFAYSILLISYPLFNSAHINIALILQDLLFIYIMFFILKNIRILKKYFMYFIAFLMIIFFIKSIEYTCKYFSIILNDRYKYEDVYFGTLFNDNVEDKIANVTKYIENSEKKVVILSPDAALYMIPLKQNNAEMDLILLGNLGKNGENSIIEKVSNLKNKIILMNREKLSYQESNNLREYVINNFEKIGEIEDLLIFEIK